jgi:hypothetical protein
MNRISVLRSSAGSVSRVPRPRLGQQSSYGQWVSSSGAPSSAPRSGDGERPSTLAREQARREQKAAEAREQYLAALAQREAEAWREVDALLATKQPGKYDAAVKLLKDLRDVAIRAGRQGEVEARLARLREQHAREPSFVGRLQAAGLIGTTKEGRP